MWDLPSNSDSFILMHRETVYPLGTKGGLMTCPEAWQTEYMVISTPFLPCLLTLHKNDKKEVVLKEQDST